MSRRINVDLKNNSIYVYDSSTWRWTAKEQCVFVPADLKKILEVLPRSSSKEYLISLALKLHLSDKSAVCKPVIWPTTVNDALRKLKEINPYCEDVIIDNQWQEVSKESDPVL